MNEKRHVGAQLQPDLGQLRPAQTKAPEAVEGDQATGRIGGAATHARFGRDLFVQRDLHTLAAAGGLLQQARGAHRQVFGGQRGARPDIDAADLAVGLSLGLLGSGGSILTVPVLVYFFGQGEKEAIASSLLVVALVALTGTALQARRGTIDWKTGAGFGIPGMASASLGAVAGQATPPGVQMLTFALTMLVAAAMMLGRTARTSEGGGRGPLAIVAAGLGVGALTGFVGVGGGFLIVPALVALAGLPMPRAVGTSRAVIALTAATGFAAQLPRIVDGSLDLDGPVIALTAGLGIAGSIAGTSIGARLPAATLRRTFGLLLLPLAATVGWSGWAAWSGAG